MKKVDVFVLKSFIGPLFITFFIVLIILILQFLWMYIDELVGKGLDFKILSELLFQFSLTFVPTALPLAILLASLMTFGNMGEYSELTALKSSGIPLGRIMKSLMFLVGLVVIIAFLFSNYVVPYSNKQARSLLYDIRRKRPDINLQAGTFNNDIDGFSIKIGAKDPVTNRLDRLIIYDQRERRGNTSITYADSGYIKMSPDESAMIMTLYNGHSFNEIEERNKSNSAKTYPSRKDVFKEQQIVFPLSGFDLKRSGDNLFKSTSWMLRMGQLKYFIDSLTIRYNNQYEDQYKYFLNDYVYKERTYRRVNDTMHKNTLIFHPQKIYDSLHYSDQNTMLIRKSEFMKDAVSSITETSSTMKIHIRGIKRYESDWHKKLTLPFACLIFFFIGAPLGAIIRKGGFGTPAVISVFFFIIWYVLSLSGEKLVEEDLVPSFFGMWASSFILLPIGIFLTYKATTDSSIMNTDSYAAFFKKIYARSMTFFKKFKLNAKS